MTRFDARDVDTFLQAHVSLPDLTRERGTTRPALLKVLEKAGVRPAFGSVPRRPTIYRRVDVQVLGPARVGRARRKAGSSRDGAGTVDGRP